MISNSYALDARVVVQHRHQTEPLEGPFTIGLLKTAPTPEGTHAEPIEAPGFQRPHIEFEPPSSQRLGGTRRSGGRVSFGQIADHAGDARYGAIYRGDEIIAYGRLVRAPGHVGPKEIAFETASVRLVF